MAVACASAAAADGPAAVASRTTNAVIMVRYAAILGGKVRQQAAVQYSNMYGSGAFTMPFEGRGPWVDQTKEPSYSLGPGAFQSPARTLVTAPMRQQSRFVRLVLRRRA